MPVYLTVFVTSTVVFSSKKIIGAPVTTITRLAMNVGQASCFLTNYCRQVATCLAA
jgi:hypothetical protein